MLSTTKCHFLPIRLAKLEKSESHPMLPGTVSRDLFQGSVTHRAFWEQRFSVPTPVSTLQEKGHMVQGDAHGKPLPSHAPGSALLEAT